MPQSARSRVAHDPVQTGPARKVQRLDAWLDTLVTQIVIQQTNAEQ